MVGGGWVVVGWWVGGGMVVGGWWVWVMGGWWVGGGMVGGGGKWGVVRGRRVGASDLCRGAAVGQWGAAGRCLWGMGHGKTAACDVA